MAKVVASIEARMASTRLPGKVMMTIRGRPVIEHIVERLGRSRAVDDIVLATTTNPKDDVLETWAEAAGVTCFRGSEDDVLRRVVEAQWTMTADVGVEVCGDMPLIDPDVIDRSVERFLAADCDLVTTAGGAYLPRGLGPEVFRWAELERVARTVDDAAAREHVTLHFHENPERYRVVDVEAPPEWHGPGIRCVLDYAEDLLFIEAVYERLEPVHGTGFGIKEIIALVTQEPELLTINADVECRPPR